MVCCEVFCDELFVIVDLFKQCCVGEIVEGVIDDYVVLYWFEWYGGLLCLIMMGENVCCYLVLLLVCVMLRMVN